MKKKDRKKKKLTNPLWFYIYQNFPCVFESQMLQVALCVSFRRKVKSWKIPRGRKVQCVF